MVRRTRDHSRPTRLLDVDPADPVNLGQGQVTHVLSVGTVYRVRLIDYGDEWDIPRGEFHSTSEVPRRNEGVVIVKYAWALLQGWTPS